MRPPESSETWASLLPPIALVAGLVLLRALANFFLEREIRQGEERRAVTGETVAE